MKFLLTSTGLSNVSIREELVRLLGRPLEQCSAVHVPTAVHALPNGPVLATEMTRYWSDLGWAALGILELTALPSLPAEVWQPGLYAADAVLVAGGNTGYLSYWFHNSGFAAILRQLRPETVYVGVSAGSYLITPALNYDPARLAATGVYYDDEYDEAAPAGAGDSRAVGLVDFHFRPHLNSPDFPDTSEAAMARAAAKVSGHLYAVDDQTALSVVDGHVTVITEGQWRLYNAPRGPDLRSTSPN